MFPTLIKCAVVFAVLIIHFLITTKMKIFKESRIAKRIFSGITFILAFILMFTPFENYFLRAETPEKVFEYTTIGTIIDKEEGNNSCAILYKTKANTFSTMILTKTDGKYQKHSSSTETTSLIAAGDTYTLHIYIRHAKNTSDHFILIGGEISEDVEITDSLGTAFEVSHTEIAGDKTQVYYLDKITYDSEYTIYINGIPAVTE